MSLSFSSKSPHVPNPKKDPKASRWIASLSDGSTVFEDVIPGESSSWRRLSAYVLKHGLKITNLRLEAYGRRVILVPYKDDEDNAQINGYWHSKMISSLICPGGVIEGLAVGIGILKGLELWITWVQQDGTTRQEIRPYKSGDLAVIVNDHPA